MPLDPAKMGDALRNYFAPKPPQVGPRQQPQQPSGPQPVSFEHSLKSLGPAMNNGQAYTNPGAVRDYQSAARAVGALYGMQPTGWFNNATPAMFRPMPQLGATPAPNPTVR